MLEALLKCQASKFDQPDDGVHHNVIKNNQPLVTNADRELSEGSKKENCRAHNILLTLLYILHYLHLFGLCEEF
jgi:hypothetical protein